MQNNSCCAALKTQLGLETLRELGKGAQGLVLLCSDAPRRIHLACKVIPSHYHISCSASHQSNILQKEEQSKKRKLPDSTDQPSLHDLQHQVSSRKRKLTAEEVFQDTQLRWEAEVLQHLSGVPGVLPLMSTVEGDDSCFHLLTPFCDAGDLLGKLDSHPPHFKLDDHEAAPIVASLARTLAACHSRGIVHRDVKPGNILLRRAEGGSHEDVFLVDFGLAATITPGEILHDRVGTSRYQAPEVIEGNYDHRADAWSLGVVLHLLLTSTLPFIEHLPHDAPAPAIHQAILCNKLELDAFGISPSAEDLLKGILCKDPNSRLTLGEILSHPWLVLNTQPKHEVSQSDFVSADAHDRVPRKMTRRVGVRRSRKSYRQHCGDMVRTTAHPGCSAVAPPTSQPGLPRQQFDHSDADYEDVDEKAKITPRVCIRPMDRKCYQQHWAAAMAHRSGRTITAHGCVC